MDSIPVTVIPRVVSKFDEAKFLAEFATFSDFDTLIDKPGRFVDEDGNFLAVYAPGAIAKEATEYWPELNSIQIETNNRGMSTGKNIKVTRNKNNEINDVMVDYPYSGTLGFFDRTSRLPFCRQTAFTADHRNVVFGALGPFWKSVSDTYKAVAPDEYNDQCKTIQEIHPDWIFPDTPFTTITINNTYRTAYHRDAGDLVGPGVAWSILFAAWEGGKSGGAHIVLPAFRVAFAMNHGDFLCFNPHLIHGNTPLGSRKRVSCVFYIREKIKQCGSSQEERIRGVEISEKRFFGGENG